MVDATDTTIAWLREAFAYDPDTGSLTRKATGKPIRRKVGAYATIRRTGKTIHVHRAIWAIVHGQWPAEMIDHINRDRSDNRLCNLRLATRSQNRANVPGCSPSGAKGVYYRPTAKTYKSWVAVIQPPGCKPGMIGRFATRDEASAVYQAMARAFFGDFACFEMRE